MAVLTGVHTQLVACARKRTALVTISGRETPKNTNSACCGNGGKRKASGLLSEVRDYIVVRVVDGLALTGKACFAK
jgi:hypothetical protein